MIAPSPDTYGKEEVLQKMEEKGQSL